MWRVKYHINKYELDIQDCTLAVIDLPKTCGRLVTYCAMVNVLALLGVFYSLTHHLWI